MSETVAKPVFDFSTPEEVQKGYLALFGLFIIIPTACMGFILTGLFVSPGLAVAGGLGAVMFIGGWMGFFTVTIRKAMQEVKIKVIQEK